MVRLFGENSYLVAVLAVYRAISAVALNADSKKMFACGCTARECFQKIAFTFTHPYLQGFPSSFPTFDVSQTFHTKFVKAMWNVCAPSHTQETPTSPYLQGLPASTVKVKAIFWKRKSTIDHGTVLWSILIINLAGWSIVNSARVLFIIYGKGSPLWETYSINSPIFHVRNSSKGTPPEPTTKDWTGWNLSRNTPSPSLLVLLPL